MVDSERFDRVEIKMLHGGTIVIEPCDQGVKITSLSGKALEAKTVRNGKEIRIQL